MRKLAVALIALALVGCSSNSIKESDKPSGCSDKDYTLSVGASEGAAGTSYMPLVMTNSSTRECTVTGVPNVQPISNGDPVGPPSRPNVGGDTLATLILKPGESASVLYAIATASNYPAEECVIASSDGVRLTLSNGSSDFSAAFAIPEYEVCTKLSSTLISKLVPGNQG